MKELLAAHPHARGPSSHAYERLCTRTRARARTHTHTRKQEVRSKKSAYVGLSCIKGLSCIAFHISTHARPPVSPPPHTVELPPPPRLLRADGRGRDIKCFLPSSLLPFHSNDRTVRVPKTLCNWTLEFSFLVSWLGGGRKCLLLWYAVPAPPQPYRGRPSEASILQSGKLSKVLVKMPVGGRS